MFAVFAVILVQGQDTVSGRSDSGSTFQEISTTSTSPPSNTVAIAEGTDFGSVAAGGLSTNEFVFTSGVAGTRTLITTEFPASTGPDYTGSFVVGGPVPSSGIELDDQSFFDITFQPEAGAPAGQVRTIYVRVRAATGGFGTPSDYFFQVTGTVGASSPQIEVLNNDGNPITGGATDDFGTVVGNFGSVSRQYTIVNNGTAALNVNDIIFASTFTSTSTEDFELQGVTLPATVAANGGSLTFNIVFTPQDPNAPGLSDVPYNDFVGIETETVPNPPGDPFPNDPTDFIFGVTGIGTAPEPDMAVTGNSNPITGDDTNIPSVTNDTYFGDVQVSGGTSVVTYTITNNGTFDLILNGNPVVRIDDDAQDNFSVSSFPGLTTLTPGQSTTFQVTFDPSAPAGLKTAEINIPNNTGSEYVFDISGDASVGPPTGSPLLITQYYEGGGSEQYLEIKNISSTDVQNGDFFVAIYFNNRTTNGIINSQGPDLSYQLPFIGAGDVFLLKNSGATGNGTPTNQLVFDGDDVILISTSNLADCYGARIDIMGVVGDVTPPSWGSNTSFIKGCGTNEIPSTEFLYDSGTNTVQDYIEISDLSEVDNANAATNLFLGTQTVGTTTYGTSWSNGIPDRTKNVVVSGTYTAASGSFEACNLTINGSINLNGGTSNFVKVAENLTINGSFTIGDTESLITTSSSSNPITGSITKLENSSPLNTFRDFTYWSSPVENANISTVFSGVERIFFWRDPIPGDPGDWVTASGSMEEGRGYIAEAPPGITQHNVSFTGTPHHGFLAKGIGFDNTWPGGFGFNLVGNPYPSAIDADTFIEFTDNDAGDIFNNLAIDGTLWFWTHTIGYQDNPGEDTDYTVDDYATYNLAGGTAVGNGSGTGSPSGSIAPNGNIASGQGFLVNAITVNAAIYFDPSMQLEGNNDQFFRGDSKKSKTQVEKDRMWLNVTSKEGGAFNQILIGFFEKATDGFDRGYDGLKYNGGNYISLYSNMDEGRYAIQGFGPYSADKKVSIGFDAYVQETFIISIHKMEGVLNTEEIYLVDNELNVVHDLKASDYEFEITEVGSFSDRFTLQFNKSVLGVEGEELNNNFIVFSEDGELRIRSNNEIKQLKVYDMLGRLLIDNKPNQSDFYLNTQNIAKGTVLVLNAVLENGAELSKKAIKY